MDLLRDPRRRTALAALVLLLVLVGWLLVFLVVRGLLEQTADCEVVAGDRTVELSTAQAEAAAAVSAGAVRRGVSGAASEAGVATATRLPDDDARVVASALTGGSRHALSCTHGGSDDTESDRLDRRGLTSRAERVRQDLDAAFGRLPVGGFAPGGVSSGHMPG